MESLGGASLKPREKRMILLMEELRLTTWDGQNSIDNWIIIILGGAGFCPSTV